MSTRLPLPRRARIVALALAVAASGGLAAAAFAAPQPLDPQARLCARPIAEAEARHRIPGQLLAAVAVAESGRWRGKERAVFAWPWTVTSGKRSWFFPTRADALAHTRALVADGVRNIDVGCMQVNLHYHGAAFGSLEEAFDPETNVAYAAGFLARLHEARRSWSLAVGLYHSATPEYQIPYRRKVMALWNKERRRAAELHRLAVQARMAADRQRRLTEQAAAR